MAARCAEKRCMSTVIILYTRSRGWMREGMKCSTDQGFLSGHPSWLYQVTSSSASLATTEENTYTAYNTPSHLGPPSHRQGIASSLPELAVSDRR